VTLAAPPGQPVEALRRRVSRAVYLARVGSPESVQRITLLVVQAL